MSTHCYNCGRKLGYPGTNESRSRRVRVCERDHQQQWRQTATPPPPRIP